MYLTCGSTSRSRERNLPVLQNSYGENVLIEGKYQALFVFKLILLHIGTNFKTTTKKIFSSKKAKGRNQNTRKYGKTSHKSIHCVQIYHFSLLRHLGSRLLYLSMANSL